MCLRNLCFRAPSGVLGIIVPKKQGLERGAPGTGKEVVKLGGFIEGEVKMYYGGGMN